MCDPADLLGNEQVRRVLGSLEAEPLAAKDLSEECDVPLTSTYRHLERLESVGLVEESVEMKDTGNHYRIYSTDFRAALIYTDKGEVNTELLERDHDAESLLDRIDERFDDSQ